MKMEIMNHMLLKKFALMFIMLTLFATLMFQVGCSSPQPSSSPAIIKVTGLQVLVQDSNNKPLSGAKVVSQSQPDGQLNVNGITTDNGITTFSGIKAGNYQFLITLTGYSPTVFNISVVPDVTVAVTINLSIPS